MIANISVILIGPLMLLVWVIDAYLLLVAARLLLERMPCARSTRALSGLRDLTDGLHDAVETRLAGEGQRVVRPWAPWAVMIVIAIVLRQLVIGVLVIAS